MDKGTETILFGILLVLGIGFGSFLLYSIILASIRILIFIDRFVKFDKYSDSSAIVLILIFFSLLMLVAYALIQLWP